MRGGDAAIDESQRTSGRRRRARSEAVGQWSRSQPASNSEASPDPALTFAPIVVQVGESSQRGPVTRIFVDATFERADLLHHGCAAVGCGADLCRSHGTRRSRHVRLGRGGLRARSVLDDVERAETDQDAVQQPADPERHVVASQRQLLAVIPVVGGPDSG